MVLGKKVAVFDWELGRKSAPRDGQKRPCNGYEIISFGDDFMGQRQIVTEQNRLFI